MQKNNNGEFTRIFAIDCETSGINMDSDDITDGYQSISWGLVVADQDFNPIDELYVEIKWDGISKWEWQAEKVHGLTKQYLENNGMDEKDAIEKIVEFIYTHIDFETPIMLLGQNVERFDRRFLNKILAKYDLKLKFAHRAFDTFSAGYVSLRANNSDQLFDILEINRAKPHNALNDAKAALKAARLISKLFNYK